MSEDVFLRVVEGEILRDTVFAVRHSARNVGYHVSAFPRRRLPGDLRAHVLSPTSAGSGTCPPRGRLRNGRSSHSGTDGSNLLCSTGESTANLTSSRGAGHFSGSAARRSVLTKPSWSRPAAAAGRLGTDQRGLVQLRQGSQPGRLFRHLRRRALGYGVARQGVNHAAFDGYTWLVGDVLPDAIDDEPSRHRPKQR
jgi:hypothetical protein